MNIVLFEAEEIGQALTRSDPRAEHILNVLRFTEGQAFDAGVVNGNRGKARIRRLTDQMLELEFDLSIEEPPLYPVDLIVGLSRPQTNRKVLREATALGARRILFVKTERGEPSYAESKLWTTGEWRRQIVDGAAQAFTTRIPDVDYGMTLEEAIARTGSPTLCVALDNYEAEMHLADSGSGVESIVMAVGAERGWTGPERTLLRKRGFALAHLGQRPLRTETATVVGLAMAIKLLEEF